MTCRRFTYGPSRRQRSVSARVASIVFVLGGVGLLASACGNGSASPGVASTGSTSTTSTTLSNASSSSGSPYDKAVAYAMCMRSNGITDMPDPGNNGTFNIKGLHPGPNSDLSPGNARYVRANRICQHLLPRGGQVTPAARQHNQAQALQWARCMRAHGLLDFPDPGSNGAISIHSIQAAGFGPESPRFQVAGRACEKYQPSNLGLASE